MGIWSWVFRVKIWELCVPKAAEQRASRALELYWIRLEIARLVQCLARGQNRAKV